MEETPGAQKDFLQQWVEMQEKLWKESMAMGQRMLSAMPSGPGAKGSSGFTPFDLVKGYFDLTKLWSKAMPPASVPEIPSMFPAFKELYETWMKSAGVKGLVGPGTWYEEFTERLKKTFGEKVGDGLGLTVFKRIASSAEVYFDVLDFWAKVLSASPDITAGKPLSEEKVKELHDEWMRNYRALMESLWGSAPSAEMQDVLKALSGTAGAGAESAWAFLAPMVTTMTELPALFQRMARGDKGAAAELGGLFAKNYEETMGKALLAPTIGYFREFQEGVNKAIYAYGQYTNAKTAFLSFLQSAGIAAAEKVFQRFIEFTPKEITPETYKELYKLWCNTNEEVYQEVSRSNDFVALAKQMVEQGLLLRKELDEISDHVLKFTNFPSKKDMDEIYLAIYETKRDLREARRRVTELEKQVAMQKAAANPSGGGELSGSLT
jgi:class III poly(R)-hydroxyalkanoic acid synthase PhaE subunit